MILKITDGDISHFVHCSGDVQVQRVDTMNPEDWGDFDVTEESTAEWMRFLTVNEDDTPDLMASGVVIRPEGLPLRTYLTSMDAYLMTDQGKTIEVLHRAA